MRKFILLLFLIFEITVLVAQDTVKTDGYQKFYFPNGQLSSEGTMREGKPDGYWKTYDDEGNLRSEGNRTNYLLDGEWKFYTDNGKLSSSIQYKEGKKSGIRTTYLNNLILVDSFEMDRKNNWNKVLYPNGNIKIKTFYVNGVEDGWSYQYAEDGRIIIKTYYINGFIRSREYINALNVNGKKQGLWKEFYDNGLTKVSGTYRDGIKDGYFKYYDINGNLTHIEKFRNGIIEDEPEELAKLEIRTDYYEDGSIKVIGSYKNGKAEGVRREYSRDGKITEGYIMHKGIVIGHGITDESGKRQGVWEIFYDNGRLQGKGKYVKSNRVGPWVFYFENGKVEQTGNYDASGDYLGKWEWFYEDGSKRIIEEYFDGEREGDFIEYAEDGSTMMEGGFVRGLKEGEWTSVVNGYKEVGSYLEDVKDGDWKYYYVEDSLYFEGRFLDGNEDGIHTWYYRNGKVMKTGKYIMSMKEGEWKYYNSSGQILLRIKYKDGIEMEYDAIRIEPEMNINEMQE